MKKYRGIQRQIKEDMKKDIEYYKSCVKCDKCGHSIMLGRNDKKICEWCGKYIFKDKKTEFMYRMGGKK